MTKTSIKTKLWQGVRMRGVAASPDPDSAPRDITLPASWDDSAAAALAVLAPGTGKVSLAEAAEAWIRPIAERARRAGLEMPLGEQLHDLLLRRRGAPSAPLWRGEPTDCPGFTLNLVSFHDVAQGFDFQAFSDAAETAATALSLAMPQARRISVAMADLAGLLAALGLDYDSPAARELAASNPDLYYYADQYSNEANWKAHYRTTAEEIWRQTEGQVTHFVAGLGTSGTFMGTSRRLRELNPAIRCISMQPDSPFNGLEGLKYMPTAIVPSIYDPSLADENIDMSTEVSYEMAKNLARTEGLLVGISAAAAVATCLQIAEKEAHANREAVIVTILCDSAEKYLSERFWQES